MAWHETHFTVSDLCYTLLAQLCAFDLTSSIRSQLMIDKKPMNGLTLQNNDMRCYADISLHSGCNHHADSNIVISWHKVSWCLASEEWVRLDIFELYAFSEHHALHPNAHSPFTGKHRDSQYIEAQMELHPLPPTTRRRMSRSKRSMDGWVAEWAD